MSAKLTTQEIDYIIDLIGQITKVTTKTDFLAPKDQKELADYQQYEECLGLRALEEAVVTTLF
jgi:hypothetical protein